MTTPTEQNEEAQQVAQNLRKQIHNLCKMECFKTDDVTVVARVRPLCEAERSACDQGRDWNALAIERSTLGLREHSGAQVNAVRQKTTRSDRDVVLQPARMYTFDAVMPEWSTTDKVYARAGRPAVAEAVRGVSAVVFAYGQTGSGKTYTMLGEGFAMDSSPGVTAGHGAISNISGKASIDSDTREDVGPDSAGRCLSEQKQGIASMVFKDLREQLDERTQVENGGGKDMITYVVEVSAIQIYLNRVYDILSADQRCLHVRAHRVERTLTHLAGEVCELVPKETCIPCGDVATFEALLQRIVAGRINGSTRMNLNSSRSHLIITLAVKRYVQLSGEAHTGSNPNGGREHMSKLILVDLAGNERDSARNGSTPAQEALLRKEGIAVNASLTALSACLREREKNSNLAGDSSDDEEPRSRSVAGLYRTTTLTRLLKEPLMSAKIFFIACCSPVASSAAPTRQTLRYASRVKLIKTNAEDSAMLLEEGLDRFPIKFLPHNVLVEHGRIPRSDERLTSRQDQRLTSRQDQRLTVFLHELRVSVVRIMVSHRWLDHKHPDDANGVKHELLCELMRRLGDSGWIRNFDMINVVNWLDFGTFVFACLCARSRCLCVQDSCMDIYVYHVR
jgi:hypothetical protein